MSKPTLTIPDDIITPIIEARVQEAILDALGDKGVVLEKAIASILNTRVDSEGKVSHYTSSTSDTWIKWAVGSRIRQAVLEAITEALAKHEVEIKRAIKSELQKKNSPMIRQLVTGMAGALAGVSKYRINVTVDE